MSPLNPSSPTTADGPAKAADRDLARALLRGEDSVFAAALAAAPTGVLITDPSRPDCPITYANKAFLEITGYTETETLGRNCRFLQGPATDPAHVHAIRRAVAEQRPIEITIANHRKGGKRFANELRIAPVFDEDGQLLCYFGIQHDVTMRERAARLALRAQRAAERASAEKSDFLAFMNNEIRNPLNGVMGTISLLLDTPLSAEQRAYAETARRCGGSLFSTINEVLDLAHIERRDYVLASEPFSVAGPVREVAERLRPAALEKGITLRTQLDPRLPRAVFGSAIRLRQVLMKLVENAVKFTSVGQVEITVSITPAGRLLYGVSDTGIGMAQGLQTRLFGRFTQGAEDINRPLGGAGLGLTICRRLVALMGGKLELESAPGKGSTFSFELPMMPAPASLALPATLPAAIPGLRSAPGTRGRILLADGGESNPLVASAILRRAGFAVDVAHDGVEALAAARSLEYDLILLEIRLPYLDGFAVTGAIRAIAGRAGRVPIYALSPSDQPEDRARCIAAGMDGHFPRPMDRMGLLHAVARALDAQPRRPRAIASRPEPQGEAIMLDHQTLEELRAAIGPGRLPRLITVFAEETRARIARLREMTDLELIEDEAHGLASAASTYAAPALRDAAHALESACRDADQARVRALIDGLDALVDRSLAAYPIDPKDREGW